MSLDRVSLQSRWWYEIGNLSITIKTLNITISCLIALRGQCACYSHYIKVTDLLVMRFRELGRGS